MEKIIFFGNGALADYTLGVLKQHFEVIFHARNKADLTEVVRLKKEFPEAHGILASFGVMIRPEVLEVFEPEGILNIHPSLLPKYRGASPIESAILSGDKEFSVSIMKLVRAMDAGPIYYQTTVNVDDIERPDLKDYLYRTLAETGAEWLVANLSNLPTPVPQDEDEATFTTKLDKSMSFLAPETDDAEVTLRKIQAFQGFPKPKYAFFDQNCIILEAEHAKTANIPLLSIKCRDGRILSVKRLQPEGKRPMDAKSFVNGYKKG